MTSSFSMRRPYIVLVVSTLIILIGGTVALLWQGQQRQVIRADGGNVVGAPSLPAATVDAIFARMGSPMLGTGKIVEQTARQNNIDDAFALAVWWVETNDGEAGVGLGDRNPGSVRGTVDYPSAFDGYTFYPSYSVAITDWFSVLKNRYVNRGLTSVYTICYPYVGTSSSALWADKVVNLMLRYRGEVPSPTPTPTPDANFARHARSAPDLSAYAPLREVTVVEGSTLQEQQSNGPGMLSSNEQNVVIGLILLVALGIGLLAIKLRRGMTFEPVAAPISAVALQPIAVPAPAVAIRSIDPITPPPLYVNEYSPLVPRTLHLLPSAFEPLIVPASPVLSATSKNEVQKSTGVLSRRHRLVQMPASPQTEQLAPSREASMKEEFDELDQRSTEALPSYGGTGLPGRLRVPVGVSSGGLLSRYGDKRSGENR